MARRFFSTQAATLALSLAMGTLSCGGAGEESSLDPSPEASPGQTVLADCETPSALEIDSRLHSCQKLSYASLGRFLSGRGVNLALTGSPDTAGELFTTAVDSLGVPKADSRLGEKSFHTTSGATRLFDICLQAAPEIISNIADPALAPACTYNGANKPMFDPEGGSCVEDSVSCLLGRPAMADDMTLCNAVLAEATPGDAADLMNKQRIAVGLVLSAGHTCE